MIARTAQDYRTEARRLDAQASAAESRGDDLAADRLRRRATLERRAAEAVAFRAIGGAARSAVPRDRRCRAIGGAA